MEISKEALNLLLFNAWGDGYRDGWGDRTLSIMERRTYEQEIERRTQNPWRATETEVK